MSKIVRKKEVSELTGLARSTIYELMADGHFPRQVHLGYRSVGWRLSEIESWIAKRPKSPSARMKRKRSRKLPAGRKS